MKKIQVGAGAFPRAGGVVQDLNPRLPELVPTSWASAEQT